MPPVADDVANTRQECQTLVHGRPSNFDWVIIGRRFVVRDIPCSYIDRIGRDRRTRGVGGKQRLLVVGAENHPHVLNVILLLLVGRYRRVHPGSAQTSGGQAPARRRRRCEGESMLLRVWRHRQENQGKCRKHHGTTIDQHGGPSYWRIHVVTTIVQENER